MPHIEPSSAVSPAKLYRQVSGDGPEDARILILTDRPSYNDPSAQRPLSDFTGKLLFDQFRQVGVRRTQIRVEALCERIPPDRKFFRLDPAEQSYWRADALDRIAKLPANVIVPLGEDALRLVTDKKSISKWQLSIIQGNSAVGCRKVIPLYHPEYILKFYKEIPFLTFGAQRIAEEMFTRDIPTTERNFILEPSLDQALAWLDQAKHAEWLSVDIETGAGQITCIGFSTEPREAISIPTLPKDYSPEDFFKLWSKIDEVLKGDSKKVAQNGIYDITYLSRYGVRVRNFYHDTMVCQKFLHPELPMGLDTVARLYTKEPYWKDDGKNWSLKQDIRQLYRYNCKDVACTLEAALAQQVDLRKRGLTKGYERVMGFQAPVLEMCWTGLPIDLQERERLKDETQQRIVELTGSLEAESRRLLGEPINPRSPLQVKKLLKAKGYRLPSKQGRESSDRESLLKLRLKDPESRMLEALIGLSEENKKLSSYLNYKLDSDNRLRYTLFIHGTETGRFSCKKDPWDRGLNAQTLPKNLKSQIRAPKGRQLIEVDLKQAEGRFVAWDAPCEKFMQMYLEGIDIHRYVASHPLLFNKPMDQITHQERQLGKKAGHAANYGMKAQRFVDMCLLEMNLVLSKQKAEQMLQGYHESADGAIQTWQRWIEEEVTLKRMLSTPFGRQRVFYDRLGHDMFKEAYAYRPQSTIPDIINELMLFLFGWQPDVKLLVQVHDSLLLEVPDSKINMTLDRIKDQDGWNPRLKLRGGELRIPIEIQVGQDWKNLEEVYAG